MRSQHERNDGTHEPTGMAIRTLTDLVWADAWIESHASALRDAGIPADEASLEAEHAADIDRIMQAERDFLSCSPAARHEAQAGSDSWCWDNWDLVPGLYEDLALAASDYDKYGR